MKEKFDSWVEDVIEERNEAVKTKRKLEIDLDPEIYKIFLASKNVSSKCDILYPTALLTKATISSLYSNERSLGSPSQDRV